MSRPLIVLGDSIDHGGAVTGGTPTTDIAGQPVAGVGDSVICAKHGATTIASGDPTLIIDGEPAARHGDQTACGATLLSSQTATVD